MRRTRESLLVEIRQYVVHGATEDGLSSRQKCNLIEEEESESGQNAKVIHVTPRLMDCDDDRSTGASEIF